LNEVTKLIQGSGLIEMEQLVLDSFWHGCICLPIERQVVVVDVKDYVNGLGARLGEVRRVRKSTEDLGRGSGRAGLGFSL
jgi:hypothetical protein